jgi:hypothetical protein
MRIAMTFLALALAASACKKKEDKPAEPTTTDTTDTAGTAVATEDAGTDMAAADGDAAMAGDATTMTKRAGNCPSTVLGATTKAQTKGKNIVLTITATDKEAVASIQRRAEELLAEKKDGGRPGGGHDQKGTHGGSSGLCPVYLPEGATAKSKKDKNGVTITITPKDNLEQLKAEIDGRITKADAWVKENIQPGEQGNQGGVGGGKGEHGGNHSGQGDSKGIERKQTGGGGGADTGGGGGKGTGGGGSTGTGAGTGGGSAK